MRIPVCFESLPPGAVLIREVPDDLIALGKEMRDAAILEPVLERPNYEDLDTEEKVLEHRRQHAESMRRLTRIVVMGAHICSLVLTMDKYDGDKFHLSMVEHVFQENGRSQHVRIGEGANFIATCVLGSSDWQEIQHEGKVYTLVRDFVRDAV